MSVRNVKAIHLRVVEVFQSAPKWWTDRLSMLARLTDSQGDTISAYSCEGTGVVNHTVYSVYKDIKQKSYKSSPRRSCNQVLLLDKLNIKYNYMMNCLTKRLV